MAAASEGHTKRRAVASRRLLGSITKTPNHGPKRYALRAATTSGGRCPDQPCSEQQRTRRFRIRCFLWTAL